MANSMKFSQWLRNPYTGEEVEITAATENSLQNKIDKQIKAWEKDQAEWERQQYGAEAVCSADGRRELAVDPESSSPYAVQYCKMVFISLL